MLENIKYAVMLKDIDRLTVLNRFDAALEKLNFLIRQDYNPSVTYLKRGRLCKKLLMLDDAYSDFTYIISHCAKKREAYYERLNLNYEIANYYEAILDSNMILTWDSENFDIKRIKFLSLVYSMQIEVAKDYILGCFDYNKYKTLQYLFNETALVLAKDEYAKGLKLLELIDLVDQDNPIKLLKEATIFGLAGDSQKQEEIMRRIDAVFPKYFVSHFRFKDMYQDKDLLEISFLLELKIFDKQGLFAYPMAILEGYKNHLEGHIIDSKECFERAVEINPEKPEGYVLLGQTLQLMSGYDNPEYRFEAEENYKKAMDIYMADNLPEKAEDMRKQIKHLNSSISLK